MTVRAQILPHAARPAVGASAEAARGLNADRAPGSAASAVSQAMGSRGIDPATLAAERSVVGAILKNNVFYRPVSAKIGIADFADKALAQVFAKIREIMMGRHCGVESADPLNVAALLGSTGYRLQDLQRLADEAPTDQKVVLSHAGIVQRSSSTRELESRLGDLPDDFSDRLSSLRGIVRDYTGMGSGLKPTMDIGSAVALAVDSIVKHADNGGGIVGYSTGIDDLDDLIDGLAPEKLIVLGGRPAMGKTAFALCLSSYVAEQPGRNPGGKVLYVSGEMSGPELGKRMLSSATGIDGTRLKRGILTEAEWELIANATDAFQKMNLEIMQGATPNEIYETAASLHASGSLRMIVVDYLQLMRCNPDEASLSRTAQISNFSRLLKEMAVEFSIPVIALAQLNRELERRTDKRPIESDLKESGAIEQDADVIIMLYRDVVYNPSTREPDITEALVRKNRDGASGTVKMKFDGSLTRFTGIKSNT